MIRFIYLFMMLLLLASCSPVVEDTVTAEQRIWQLLRQIKVNPLSEYQGQLLQQQLEVGLNNLQKKAPHKYNLAVSFSSGTVGLTGANSFQAKASIKLYRIEDNQLIFASNNFVKSRYSSVGSDYRQEKSRASATERSINQLSRKIISDIQNYFLAAIRRDDL